MYTLGQSSLTFTTDSNCKQSLETIKLETQASPITFSEELKTMCKHQQDSKPIHILSWPKVEKHALPKTEVPLDSLVAPVKIESVESRTVTTNLVPPIKEEGIDSVETFQDQRVCGEKSTDGNNPNSTSKMCGSGGVGLIDYTSTNSTIRNIPKGREKMLFNKKNHLSCKTCGKCLASKESLEDHQYLHFPTHEFGCDFCDKLFSTKRQLKRHVRHNHYQKKHECKVCLKSYTTKYYLFTHQRLHQRKGLPKEHLCDICGHDYNTLAGLKSHISNVHLRKKRYICDICGGRYGDSHSFSKHMAIHSEDKSFICALCDRCFKRRVDVKNHISRAHPKSMGLQIEKLHCSLCEKVYSTKLGLKKHMVSHSGERKFVCDLCGKRFMHPFDLSKHKKSSIHNGK